MSEPWKTIVFIGMGFILGLAVVGVTNPIYVTGSKEQGYFTSYDGTVYKLIKLGKED